jgi:D-serine deaminase-like pyridoxal phosphate-dependent protein
MIFSELPTPCLLLDKDKLMANILRMQAQADDLGVQLRPHLKTMKSARAAQVLIASGACGIESPRVFRRLAFVSHADSRMHDSCRLR